MGPNPLWLLEDLAHDLDLHPGMRVLDLGSGAGATSVFLAREYGVDVVAADLWIAPEQAAQVSPRRVSATRWRPCERRRTPCRSRSRASTRSSAWTPRVLRHGGQLPALPAALPPARGQLGMATPAMTREIRELGMIPPHIKEVVGWEAIAWHTAEWWRFQWDITELVKVTSARLQQDAWQDWLLWAQAGAKHHPDGQSANQPVIEMLTTDRGEFLSFALVTAHKN